MLHGKCFILCDNNRGHIKPIYIYAATNDGRLENIMVIIQIRTNYIRVKVDGEKLMKGKGENHTPPRLTMWFFACWISLDLTR